MDGDALRVDSFNTSYLIKDELFVDLLMLPPGLCTRFSFSLSVMLGSELRDTLPLAVFTSLRVFGVSGGILSLFAKVRLCIGLCRGCFVSGEFIEADTH